MTNNGTAAEARTDVLRMTQAASRRSRVAYLATSLVLTVLALAAVAGVGRATAGLAAGAVAAWAVQAGCFWTLLELLDAGRSVVRTWVGGMAARAAGLVAAILAGGVWGGDDVPIGYGVGLLGLLLLEAVWMGRRVWRARNANGDPQGLRDRGRST